jgi:hypothetical protein
MGEGRHQRHVGQFELLTPWNSSENDEKKYLPETWDWPYMPAKAPGTGVRRVNRFYPA